MKRLLLLLFALMLVCSSFAKRNAELPPSKIGILWSSWSVSNFANHEDYIAVMEDWGIEYVSLNPTYFLDTYAKGILTEWNGERVTPTIDNQKEIIKALITHGFYINYRPHVDPIIYAMPEGNDRSTWSTDPGGKDWRGVFDKMDPTSASLGYKEMVILPGLQMLAQAIRETKNQGIRLRTPIRFDLGAELMNSMLNYPTHWSDLRDEVRNLLNTTYSDVKDQIVIGHNFCHHIEYLLRLDGHPDYFTRIMADNQPDYSLLYLDRPGVTQETRNAIGRYIVGLDQISISQYMPLDIFTPEGQTTTPEEVEQALYWHEENFIRESLMRECSIKAEELPVLHIGEYGMGWRGLNAPNVWDVAAWDRAGRGNMILSESQQKEDAAIAIDGIIRYVEDPTDTQFRSFLLWFGGKPYDVLNINSYSNWNNPSAAESLRQYWARHKGLPALDPPSVDYEVTPITLHANAGSNQSKTDDDYDGLVSFQLDGSASTSDDAPIQSYSWTWNGAAVATGAKTAVSLPVGVHTIMLTVTDTNGQTATAKVVLTAKASVSQEMVLDDFEGYKSNSDLTNAWKRNENGAGMIATLSNDNPMEGLQSMQLAYDLSGNSYAGVMKACNTSVSGYEGIRYSVRGDASGADLLIQLRDNNDHYWKYTIQLTSNEPQEIFMPFGDFVGGYNTSGKWTNPSAVTEVAYYVEKGTKGTIWIDDVRASMLNVREKLVAEAGDDITINLDDTQTEAGVRLDASKSIGNIVSYKWTEGERVLAQTETANLTFPAGTHLVYLTVTNAMGDTHSDYLFVNIVKKSTTSITAVNMHDNLLVYPNPVNSRAFVILPDGAKKIEVYNTTGQCIKTHTVSDSGPTSFDTENIPDGLYVVRALSDTNVLSSSKMMVKH